MQKWIGIKRVCSWLLVFSMLLSMLPVGALATQTEETVPETTVQTTAPETTAPETTAPATEAEPSQPEKTPAPTVPTEPEATEEAAPATEETTQPTEETLAEETPAGEILEEQAAAAEAEYLWMDVNTDALSNTITVTPGQLDPETFQVTDSEIYGYVAHYPLKKGHILSISDTNYVFSVRTLAEGNYSTMLKEATTASFTATEDMTVAMLIRKPDKSAVTAEELASVVIYDSQYGMIGVEGTAHRFTVEAETIDGGTATTRANIFLPTSYSETGTPTRLIVMTNGHSAYLTNSVWNKNTADNVGIIRNYLNAGYAVYVVDNTAGRTTKTPDLGCPQLVSSYRKAYAYIQQNFNVEEKISIHSRSFGTFAAMRLMREIPELIKCAVMTGPRVSIPTEWPGLDKEHIANRFGFADTTGATFEADKVVGYDPYTDVDGDSYPLPPTYWAMSEGDSTAKPIEVIEKLIAHGNDVTSVTHTGTDHTGVCTLNTEEMFAGALAFLNSHQTEETPEEHGKYEGKVISVLGDSISTFAGYIPVADGFNLEHLARYPQDNLVTDVNETWWMQVVNELGAKLGINDSWRGATVSGAAPVTTGTTGENAAMHNLTRVQNLGSNGTPDVILFYGGTNDLAHVSNVGTFDASTAPTAVDLTTTKWDNLADGYVHTLLRLKHFYPDAVIVAMLPTYTASYYSDTKLAQANAVLAEICDHYGVAWTDLRDSGVTASYLPDGIHPGAEGMDFITDAVLAVLAQCDVTAGENTVHAVTHNLTNVKASQGHYKGITGGKAFSETLTAEGDMEVIVTMGGQDITESCYADGVISIDAVTGALNITAKAVFSLGERLQALPEGVCGGTNLWPLLEHDTEYYTATGWAAHVSGKVRSVTVPVTPGDQLWATSFGASGSNGGTINGIRLTWFDENGLLESVGADAVYTEFAANGYITVPETANAANVVMWTADDSNEFYIRNLPHSYENGICIWCADWNICWEVGTIAAANGANSTNTTRIRTLDYLRLSDFAGVCVNNGYQLTWLAYDADKNYIGNGTSSFTGYWQPSGHSIATADIQDLYADAVYFRLALKNVSDGTITLEDADRSGVTFVPSGQALPEPEYELEYESLLNIGVWQDGAIWNDKLFVLGAAGTGAVYDLENLSRLATFSLDSADVLKPHANSVCFGSTYYSLDDQYPLLYVNVYNNYASAEDRMEGTCCVYRISDTDSGFATELVQIIRIGFVEDLSLWKSQENNGDVRPYGNFLVDTDDNKLYAYVMRDAAKTTRFFKFDLPELTDGIYSETYGCNVVTLERTDIEGQFDTEYFNYLQGGSYSSGMILSAEGFNSGSSAEPALRIVDLQIGTVSATYYMANSGLTTEPEVVCIDPATGLLYYVPADGIVRILSIPDVHFHGYTACVTAPTCTEQGYTTYTCECGDSYVDDYVDATGHTYANGVCTVCGEKSLELKHKTISVLGASISTYGGTSNGAAADTTNSTIRSNAQYYPSSVVTDVTLNDTWWMQAAEDLGLRLLVNNSWSGSSLLYERSGTLGAYVDRCVQLHDDTGDNAGETPDIIAIQMGTNDFQYYKDTLGTADIDYAALITDNGDGSFTYAEPATSLEAAAIVLHKISVRYPNAEVYYLNISQRVDGTDELIQSFNAELKQVVEHFGAHIVDIYGSAITMEDFDTYIGDGRVHPNKLGMDAYTEAFKKALLGNTAYEAEANTVSFDLTGVSADYGTDKIVVSGDTFTVNLTAPAGDSLDVTVTMNGEDITDSVYAGGTVTIDAVTADVTITAESVHIPETYRWEFDGTDLACVSGENALTRTAGSVTDGVFATTCYTLEKEVVLSHAEPWAVEWKCQGTWKNSSGSGGRMFTTTSVNADYNARYIFKSNTNGILAMGEKTTTGSHNYGIALADHDIDWTALHTYRLENRISEDGSNMIYLFVDGVEIGPMNHYYVGTTDKNTTSDWLSGKDFTFGYMGTDTHGLNNCSVDYIQIWEAGDPETILAGKTISILGDSISTFAGVSNDTSANSTLSGSAIYYNPGTLGVNRADTWWQQTIDALGLKLLVNNSWSGSCVLHTRSGTVGAYADRCVQLHNDTTGEEPDIIAVFLGTNDFSYYQSALGTADIDYATLITDNGDGTYTYAVPATTCEAYAIMLHKMVKRYPDADIYCMTLTARRSPDKEDSYADVGQPTAFNAELAEIIDYFGCTAVDLETCGIEKEAEVFDRYMGDGRVHPNAEGMDKITEALISAMLGEAVGIYDVTSKLIDVTLSNASHAVLPGGSYEASVMPKNGYTNITVAVTMGEEDVTESCYADGVIAIDSVTGDIVITAAAIREPLNFRWEFDGADLAAVSTDGNTPNALAKLEGTITDGIFSNTRYQLSTPMALAHDRPWIVEWRGEGEGGFMLATGTSTGAGPYFFRRAGSYLHAFGELNSGSPHNYGLEEGSFGIDGTKAHTYRLENRIAEDGANMVYLLVDGIEAGPMTGYYIGGTSQNTNSDWISGKDFQLSYIGTTSHPLTNYAMDYLQVWENGHTHSYEALVTAPTCLEGGYTTYTCTLCGSSYVADDVEALGHTEVIDAEVAAICTATGLTEGKHCGRCGEVLTAQVVTQALGHDLGQWETVTEADCTADGFAQRTCSRCDYTEEKALSATGHSYTATVVEPTCTQQGYTAHVCDTCGYEKHDAFAAALGHTAVTDEAVAATCTATGLTEGKHCDLCGEVLIAQTLVKAKGHTDVIDAEVAATCTATGLTEGTHCSVCDEILIAQTTVKALGHDMTEWSVETSPTCKAEGLQRRSCGRCDLEESEVLPALGHTYDSTQVVPTCTAMGYTAHICQVCGYEKHDAFVKPLGHREDVRKAVAPTCTETGLTAGTYCLICDEILSAQKTVEALGHSYEAAVTTAPGCETEGVKTYTCTVCDDAYTESLAATGHTEGEAVTENETAATCTVAGSAETVVYCSVCKAELSRKTVAVAALGHTEVVDQAVAPTCTASGLTAGRHCAVCDAVLIPQESLAALGHTWDSGKVKTAPTEETDGVMEYSCQRCAATREEAIPSLSHVHEYETQITAPTCTEGGYTTCTCKCGDSHVKDLTKALGHELGQWSMVTEATCTDAGQQVRTCTRCDYEEQTAIPAAGHKNKVETVAPTCTAMGYTAHICQVCGYENHDTFVAALGHQAVIDAAVAPTCTETGLTEGRHCDLCKAVLVAQTVINAKGHTPDGAATCTTNQICTVCKAELAPAKGHVEVIDKAVAPTCTATGLTEGRHCAVCKEVLTAQTVVDALGHSYDEGLITTAPGCETAGVKTYTCTVCGDAYTESLSATGHTEGEAVTENETAATCTAAGSAETVAYCSVCHAEMSREAVVVEALGHTEVVVQALVPTCTATGLTEGKHCSVCGEVLVAQTPVDALGHTEVIDTAVAPTCTTTGLTEGKHCERCGEILMAQDVIPATGHDFAVGICRNCGERKPADFELFAGKSLALKVVDPYTNRPLSGSQIRWTLEEAYEPFATVAKSGKLTAKKVVEKTRIEVVGTITATQERVAYIVDIYPAVTQLEVLENGEIVNGKTLIMDFTDDSITLKADAYPLDTLENVTWTVSDKKGQYAAYEIAGDSLTITNPTDKAGTVTVKATITAGVKKTVTVKVQFGSFAQKVDIAEPEKTTLRGGEKLTLSAMITEPESVTKPGLVWSTSDKNTATVSNGKVTAKNVAHPTLVTITATSKDGQASASIQLKIVPKNEGQLVLMQDGAYATNTIHAMNVGETYQVTASRIENGNPISETATWTTSKATVATVENGLITAVGVGTAKITAEANGMKATINIKVGTLVESMEITTKDGKNLIEENGETMVLVSSGKGVNLVANVNAGANKAVTWEVTEGAEYVKISSSGKLTANKDITGAHYVTVRATAKDGSGANATIRVKVVPLATGVQIYQNGTRVRSNTVFVVDMLTSPVVKLNAKVFPAKANQAVEFTSSNRKTADFVNGELVCYKPGTVTITAKALDGSNAKTTFKLTVIKRISSLTLKDGANLTVTGGKSLKLAPMVEISPMDATNKKLSWSVAPNEYGIKISTSGVLSTKKVTSPVTVNVMVTTQDGSGLMLNFDVTVTPN